MGLCASQFANPIGSFGDAVLYALPGAFLEDLIVAKTARDALRFPGVCMIH